MASSTNNRYWESYLPRYLAGFIVGAVCVVVMYLYYFHGDRLLFPLSWSHIFGAKPEPIVFIMIAAMGVGFCYVSSTPITVLHAGRFHGGGEWWLEKQVSCFWGGWVISIIFTLMGLLFNNTWVWQITDQNIYLWFFLLAPIMYWVFSYIILECPVLRRLASWFLTLPGCAVRKNASSEVNQYTPKNKYVENLLPVFENFLSVLSWAVFIFLLSHLLSDRLTSRALLFMIGFPAVFICIGQYVVILRLKSEEGEKEFLSSYAKLSRARQKEWSSDIREAYSHLREHSNAIFIVICEISILCLILFLRDFIPEQINVVIAFFLGCLCIWLTPTVFIWSRANVLECNLKDFPGRYK